MNKISAAKKVFHTINEELDKVLLGEEGSRRIVVQKLKLINEELSDAVIDLMKKNATYEQERNIQRAL
jgi:hypothetical protein